MDALILGAVIIAIALCAYLWWTKENYGGPPGTVRAVHHDELGDRGWADAPPMGEPCEAVTERRQARSASAALRGMQRTA